MIVDCTVCCRPRCFQQPASIDIGPVEHVAVRRRHIIALVAAIAQAGEAGLDWERHKDGAAERRAAKRRWATAGVRAWLEFPQPIKRVPCVCWPCQLRPRVVKECLDVQWGDCRAPFRDDVRAGRGRRATARPVPAA